MVIIAVSFDAPFDYAIRAVDGRELRGMVPFDDHKGDPLTDPF